MNDSCALSATIRYFNFQGHEGDAVFACMVFSETLPEAEKRRLILDGFARIDLRSEDKTDLHELGDYLKDDVEEMLAETKWEEPRIPVIICAHQEMCLVCAHHYVQCIRRKIEVGDVFPYGFMGVPRALFYVMKKMIRTQSRVPPASLSLN